MNRVGLNVTICRGVTRAGRLALALMACLLGACAFNPATGGVDVVTMSESQEIEIGKKMHDELAKAGELYQREPLERYVESVGQRLAAVSHRTDIAYSFHVIDSPEINAFALPGGYIYINRGLLAYLRNEAQLAAVLAHEIGHVTARHAVRQKTAQSAGTVMSIITFIGTGSATLADLTQLGSSALVSGYGREHELEADRLGAIYLRQAGYDSKALIEVIELLKDQELYAKSKARARGEKPQSYHGLFATHPRNDTRLQQVVAEAGKAEGAVSAELGAEAFRLATTDMAYGPRPKSVQRDEQRYYHNKLGFTFLYPEGWTVDAGSEAISVQSAAGDRQLVLRVKRANSALDPREFLQQEMAVATLFRSEPLQQYGLTGHTGVQPQAAGGESRLGVIYMGGLAYIFSAALAQAEDDAIFLDIIRSFRAIKRAELQARDSRVIRYIQASAQTRFAELARSSRIRDDAEQQLRLINGYYPRGEPTSGEWIKVVE